MSERMFRRLLWIGSVLVLIMGLGMTIHSVGQMDKVLLKLKNKLDSLDRLRSMEREINRYVIAQQAFEQLSEKYPASLADLLKGVLPGHKVDDIREIRRESIPGWTVRQTEIVFSEVPLGDLMEFVCKAETQRPPWRLIKCNIKASPRIAGSGQVVLLLEALEKTEDKLQKQLNNPRPSA